jgi:hypothetical protein
MSGYERSWIPVGSLEVGNVFELPNREDTVCRVDHHSLVEEEGLHWHIIGYSIIEGRLHWPVIYLPHDYQVVLLLPTTTYVKLSGKEWVDSLTEHHGVKEN